MHGADRSTNRVRLGNFLRTRRARLSPADFGLPPAGRRRTPGLRREEVAQLAGISIAYYTWIEQGRQLNTSRQVLESIAHVLRFTHAERAHLFTLAGLEASEDIIVEDANTHPALADLLTNAPGVCALTYDTWFNVLAATSLATQVYGLRPDEAAEPNLLYRLFAEPAQRCLWVDWEGEARMLVGMFRNSLARWPGSSAGKQLLELLFLTPDFASVWEAYDVRLQPSPDEYFQPEPFELNHPDVGTLRIHRIAMTVPTRRLGTVALNSPADALTSSKFKRLLEPGNVRRRMFLVSA